MILVSRYLVNIIILSTIEFYYPEIVTPYPNREVQIKDMTEAFIMVVFLLIYIVNSGKRLYLKEKQNTIDIIKQHRISSEMLKNEYNNKCEQLSIREREVFLLIIKGKTNREIADELYIEIGTVKSHIYKIYKKLGTKNRKETINFVIKHQ